MAIIEKYDLNTFKLLSVLDFSEIPIIKKNQSYISSQLQEDNSYYVQFKDSYLANNSIYLLCSDFGKKYKVNHLIEISLHPKMEVVKIHVLPGKIYTSFCVSSKYIFAYNHHEGFIERIKLQNE